MNIRNRKEFHTFASQRLENAPQAKTIAAIFAAVVIGLSVLSAVINYVLELRIDQTGGLSNMGTRSVLSAIQTMLPIVQSVIVMCMELGFVSSMMRVARGQYTSPNAFRLGFDRFWILLRYKILESLLFVGMGMGSMYFGIMLYLMTPLAAPVTELLTPVVAQSSLLNPNVTVSAELYAQLMEAMVPAFLIVGAIYLIAAVPLMYRLRMSAYVIIDRPGLGALAAMRESRKMTKGSCMDLFRLDLSLWWFFLAQVAASVVCYGDMILPALGISLPFPEDIAFFLFYGLYWAAEFAIFYFLRSHVEVVYALAYDAIRPKEEPSQGVVLGSIFEM